MQARSQKVPVRKGLRCRCPRCAAAGHGRRPHGDGQRPGPRGGGTQRYFISHLAVRVPPPATPVLGSTPEGWQQRAPPGRGSAGRRGVLPRAGWGAAGGGGRLLDRRERGTRSLCSLRWREATSGLGRSAVNPGFCSFRLKHGSSPCGWVVLPWLLGSRADCGLQQQQHRRLSHLDGPPLTGEWVE